MSTLVKNFLNKNKFALSTCQVAILSIACSLLIIAQLALAFLPNVELVSLLIIIYTLNFKNKALYVIYAFVIVEGIIFGFSIWWFAYLYIWLILFFLTVFLKKLSSSLFWATVAAIFGLMFGTLSSIPYFFIGGVTAVFAYILTGIPFDLIHCFSNFIIVFCLFKPLNNICNRVVLYIF